MEQGRSCYEKWWISLDLRAVICCWILDIAWYCSVKSAFHCRLNDFNVPCQNFQAIPLQYAWMICEWFVKDLWMICEWFVNDLNVNSDNCLITLQKCSSNWVNWSPRRAAANWKLIAPIAYLYSLDTFARSYIQYYMLLRRSTDLRI